MYTLLYFLCHRKAPSSPQRSPKRRQPTAVRERLVSPPVLHFLRSVRQSCSNSSLFLWSSIFASSSILFASSILLNSLWTVWISLQWKDFVSFANFSSLSVCLWNILFSSSSDGSKWECIKTASILCQFLFVTLKENSSFFYFCSSPWKKTHVFVFLFLFVTLRENSSFCFFVFVRHLVCFSPWTAP